ncbi:MAG: HDIG domain-containing metalloprotein [Aggregatilineales bacterium]|nr:HDIG domain-containing protein [Aggregatilineales bacterium]
MNRDEALAIVREFVQNENLINHMLAVEAAMRAYARKYGEDEESWGRVGLLHDFDWEIHPTLEQHPMDGAPILRERGVPEEDIRTILSHAAEQSGVPRVTLRDRALYAVDELTGLVTAVALVRPSKDIRDVTVKSIKKKWKDRAFAAGVIREDVEQGCAELGVDLWSEHVPLVLEAMQGIAAELGLDGRLAG